MKSKSTNTKKKNLPTIKSLKAKAWKLTVELVRKRYTIDTCYICKQSIVGGKFAHTGHLFKAGSLPLSMRYDIRLLRPCCVTCNLYRDGNEARYVVEVIREVGIDSFMKLVYDIENTPDIVGIPAQREYLLSLIDNLDKTLKEC